MAAVVLFNIFLLDLVNGVHDFDAHVFKGYLTNDTPSVEDDAVKADLAEISAGNGYTAGGVTSAITTSRTGSTAKIVFANVSWTATPGNIGPFRYLVLYNDTVATDPLIAYSDYGSAVTLLPSEIITFNLDASGLINLSV